MYRCKCGYTFDESLGKYGCPNCQGDNIAVLIGGSMTRYEELESKVDACTQCALRCYNNGAFTMSKIWARKAVQLDDMAREEPVDEKPVC